MERKKTKKWLIGVSVGIVVILLLCTFLSRSIYSLRLQTVETSAVRTGELTISSRTQGEAVYLDKDLYSFPVPLPVLEVLVTEGAMVKEGALLARVDITECTLQLKQLNLAVTQVRNQLNAEGLTAADRSALQTQLEIAQEEVALYQKQFPANGEIVAASSGVVSYVGGSEGQSVTAGESIIEVIPDNAKQYIVFSLYGEEGEKYPLGSSVNISFVEESKTVTKQAVVNRVQYNVEQKAYVFYTEADREWNLLEGRTVDITVVLSSDYYQIIVPLSALSEGADGSGIFVAEAYSGLFGEEYRVKFYDVTVLAQNEISAAVEMKDTFWATTVVSYTTGPIYDGDTVKVTGVLS